MSRPLQLADLADLALPAQPAVAPDGRTVVWVLRTVDAAADADVHALWAARADGDGWADPVPLTAGPADTDPAFSPDGSTLAFLRGDGGGPAQLHLLPVAGGEAVPVTDLPLGAGAPVWSPDGARLAFTAPVRPGPAPRGAAAEHAPLVTTRLGWKADGAGHLGDVRTQLHVLDRATGEVTRLTSGEHAAGTPAWSPDGTRLAFTAATGPDADRTGASAAHVVRAAGGPPRPVGPAGTAGAVLWAGEDALLVTGQERVEAGPTQLLRVPLDGGPVTDLTAALDRSVMPGGPGYPGGPAQLTPDGDTVVLCVRDRGCTRAVKAPADGSGDPRPLVGGGDVVVSGLSVAARADVAAVVLADPGSYGEVAVVPLTGGEPVRLTRLTAQRLPDVALVRPTARTFTAPDGRPVPGWLLRDPALTGPGPVLVDVHGGPHNAWSPAADAVHPYHQVLAGRGWTVLLLDIRGSDGYGREHWTAAVGRWGQADEQDVLGPLDDLVAEGIADPDRLALTGYSYGGFMTCWLTGRTDRFAVAVAGGVVADLTSMWGTSDVGPLMGGLEWPDPLTDPAALAGVNPWTRVDRVTTPTLVLHGAADERCPAGQAELWFSALRSRGVPTELVLYPGASHLFIVSGRPSHRADLSRRIIDWTERHVTTTPLDTAHWQQRLDELAAAHQVPGAVLAVLRVGRDGADDELVETATGVLNRGTGVEVTTDSVFQIGSISKVWTATLVMQLVEEGKLDLDAPVVEVLPDLALGDPDVTKRVTMRHLLTHTSGIDGDVFTDTGRGDDVLEKYVAALADVGQNHPLGATFSYCNSGFSLAGRVVEVLTGKTWDAVLRERITEPLGLTRTSTLPEEAILHRAAVGHVSEGPDQPFEPVSTFLLPRSAGPAGLINASARDVTTFARAHMTGGAPLLSAATAADMQAEQTRLPDAHTLGADSWGLGWIRFGWDGQRLYGHDGTTFGQNAYLRVLPDAGLVVVLLTNGGHTADLFRALVGEVVGDLAGVTMAEQIQPPEQAPDLDLSRYTGTYERSSVRTEVSERDGGLVLRMVPTGPLADAPGHAPEELPLHAVADGLFCAQPPGQESWMAVTFYALPDGSEYVHYGVRANPKVS